MTWSIIARDNLTGQFGIAVATKFFAVGARVPHIAAGIGGVATQALVNPYYGIDGVKLLQDGKSPQEIVAALLAADAGSGLSKLLSRGSPLIPIAVGLTVTIRSFPSGLIETRHNRDALQSDDPRVNASDLPVCCYRGPPDDL